MILFVTAISLGLAGSLHCAGMCGPLVLALPLNTNSSYSKIFSILVYNGGRILSYSLLGFICGLLGAGFSLIGGQQILSVTAGVLILLFILFPKISSLIPVPVYSNKPYHFIKSRLVVLFRRRTLGSLFLTGSLNGFLPCGLVYVSLTAAIASGNALQGALFMLFFGLGTLPVMYGILWFSHLLSLRIRKSLSNLTPYVVTISALLLILRGMNLGIPMLSPASEGKTMKCCASASHCKK